MQKLNYGVDAPKVIRNLLIVGTIFLINGIYIYDSLSIFSIIIIFFPGIAMLFEGSMMLLYSKVGKYHHRERMLKLINWKGDETVLDIGCGLGLLMNGAAKKLTTGKSFGIDIWSQKDLSNNTEAKAMTNADIEGVASNVEIKNENIIYNSFQDNYFDVILSNLCLHNINTRKSRDRAIGEIHRVLKIGGRAIISDFKHTKEYLDEFNKLGMDTKKVGTYYFDTFPPLTIISAVKK